jgi:hypothetical protein
MSMTASFPLATALTLLALPSVVLAQAPPDHQQHHPGGASATQTQSQGSMPMGHMMQGTMGGMMGGRGMGSGMMGQGMTGMAMVGGHGHMMKVMFAIADTNGDRVLSFEEVTAIHRRLFDRVDANKDGQVSIEEVQAFMRD